MASRGDGGVIRPVGVALSALVALGVAGGCADDEEPAAPTTTTVEATTSTTAASTSSTVVDDEQAVLVAYELGDFLALRGYSHEEVEGIYIGDRGERFIELGWQAIGVPDSYAITLGFTYGQEAVLANGTMYHLRRPAAPGRIRASHAAYVQTLDAGDLATFRSPHTRLADGSGWTAVFPNDDQLTYWPA